jgi:beta-glucosidase
MVGKYAIASERGNLLFHITKKDDNLKVIIEILESGMKMMPEAVSLEENKIHLETVFFMFPNVVNKATLKWKDGAYEVEGDFALVGAVSGEAVAFTGKTKYELMLEELPNYRTGKEISRTETEIEFAVEELLTKMTLEEKIGQMSQSGGNNTVAIGGEVNKIMTDDEAIEAGCIGSMILMAPAEIGFEKQKLAVEKSRLGIPLMFCQDVIHGYQTIFPIPLGWSCSFNPKLLERAMSAAAKEASTQGIMYGFSPMLDIARDPRWGRVSEGNGEDPYLCSRMCEAHVKGFQGKDLYASDTILACLKHFVGYSAAEGGRDYNSVEISDTTLRNLYLPPFQAGIDAGAASIMNSFNVMNNIPVVINKRLCNDMLRKEMGFDGILISDYASVTETVVHGAAEDGREAAEKALHATLDIEMASMNYNLYLAEAVKEGRVEEEQINACVRRILTYKFKSGLMDDPFKYFQPEKEEVIYCPEHLELSYELARESIVLLKNDQVLPLTKEKKVALIGPKADSTDVLGPWQFSSYSKEAVTLKQGLTAAGIELLCEAGCGIDTELEGGVERAVLAAQESDVIILALGENQNMSGEAASRQNIVIPQVQLNLAMELKKLNKPMVLVLTNGRPLLLDWFEEHVDAILETWFLGSEAGRAIADVLVGNYNPSGKLSITFPRHQGQIPIYYNHLRTGRPFVKGDANKFLSKYIDGSNDPLYYFGYGLSYTSFTVDNLRLSTDKILENDTLVATVTLKNAGKLEGTETVQLYLHDVAAQISRPVKELKGFQKLSLAPGAETEVRFEISKELLSYYNQAGEKVVEPGKFIVFVGTSSREEDLLQAEFVLG